MGVFHHYRFILDKGFAHIGAGTNRAFLGKITRRLCRYIHNQEQWISQKARHIRLRLFGENRQCLPVSFHFLIIKEGYRPFILGKGSLQGGLDRGRVQRLAIGELDPVSDLKGPAHMVVADLPAVCQPRLHIHFFVKLR